MKGAIQIKFIIIIIIGKFAHFTYCLSDETLYVQNCYFSGNVKKILCSNGPNVGVILLQALFITIF